VFRDAESERKWCRDGVRRKPPKRCLEIATSQQNNSKSRRSCTQSGSHQCDWQNVLPTHLTSHSHCTGIVFNDSDHQIVHNYCNWMYFAFFVIFVFCEFSGEKFKGGDVISKHVYLKCIVQCIPQNFARLITSWKFGLISRKKCSQRILEFSCSVHVMSLFIHVWLIHVNTLQDFRMR